MSIEPHNVRLRQTYSTTCRLTILCHNRLDDGPRQSNCGIECLQIAIDARSEVQLPLADDYTVPAGSMVIPSFYNALHDPAVFPDPDEFKPERWLDDEKGVAERAREMQGYHHLLSFVDGQRMCLGRAFAVAEFKVRSNSWALVF